MAIDLELHARAFVGREAELSSLEDFACSGAEAVAFVHGIAGIGKSALVATLAARLADAEVDVLTLDCRTIEPTPRGLESAAGDCFGSHAGADRGRPRLLILDHYEVFRLMDTWLRQVFIPGLPEGTSAMLAGREPPVAGWFSLPAGFRSVPLGALPDEDALGLLNGLGVAPGEATRLNRIARGHPLALTLAVAGVAARPDLELEEAASGRVIDELARLYLWEVTDPVARRSLEAASVVRRVTEPLLGAMLVDDDAADATDRLLRQPFVEAGRDGLVVHEAVRDAIRGFLRGSNPIRYRDYRRAAWRELREEVSEAAPAELWRYTADMLYLIENPAVREAFFPSGAQPLAVEPARPEDAAAIAAIARRHEPPEAADLIEAWWDAEPGTFSVVRDRDGIVASFFSLLSSNHIRSARQLGDPVVDVWARHLLDNPTPRGQVALGLRRWLDAERGELPCASQAACWLDTKRTYMALRPALRRMYTVVHDVPTYLPVVETLGFRPVPDGAVDIGGVAYGSVVLDFGPGSVDGWLADLVGAELGVAAEGLSDAGARELVVRGTPCRLTPLEYGLFTHLRQREGKAVSRSEILLEVWGTAYTGGSNVVDAVVRSLRIKLGPAAPAVETVRGTGYRLRSDWRAFVG